MGDGFATRGWLTPEAVSALVSDVPSSRPRQEAEQLILEAFRQAQESTKQEWTSMTVPVLKNRLLQLSSKRFNETDFGSPNIWHFVTQFPELIKAEGERPRETVRMLQPQVVETDPRDTPAALDPAAKGRIRQDLWQAVFDYASQRTYVWDETLGRARALSEQDRSDLPVIPTLSTTDMKELRQEFVEAQRAVAEKDVNRLQEWVDRGGPTVALPRIYRSLWNAHLKSHAANRLRAFFLNADLDVPKDLVATASHAPDHAVESARRLAHRYIDAMTAEELDRLSIELAVVMRVSVRSEK